MNDLSKQYNEKSFWDKIQKVGKKVGVKVLRPALRLYFAAKSPDCPAWAKATVYGSLAYFVMPLDAIPDIMTPFGYTDDIGVMVAALKTIKAHVGDKERALAEEKLQALGLN